MAKSLTTAEFLKSAYYRLRRQCTVLRDGGDKTEGHRWNVEPKMIWRRADGWEIRVYPVETGVEVCLIDPKGRSRAYA